MKMSTLLSRNSHGRPGVAGTARVDRDIDRLLRRVGHGDIVVLDVLDLDRVTADALVDAGVVGVVNASPSISGRYPNLGPEVLVANNIVLIDNAGQEVFKKIKDGAKVRLHEAGVYSGDRRIAAGVERTDEEIADLMHDAKTGLVAHVEAFAGNTIEFIRSESPLPSTGSGFPISTSTSTGATSSSSPTGPAPPMISRPSSPSSRSISRCSSASVPVRTFCARPVTAHS